MFCMTEWKLNTEKNLLGSLQISGVLDLGWGGGGGGRLQGEIPLSSTEALAGYLNKNSNNKKIASGAHRDLGEWGSSVCAGNPSVGTIARPSKHKEVQGK